MPVKIPAKPVTSLKRIGRGPFRGPTPKKVIQTLDVGAGPCGARFIERSEKQQQRKYVGVDPAMMIYGFGKNFETKRIDVNSYLLQLIKSGIKVRHLNFDMPNTNGHGLELRLFFRLLPKVLLPNGKIFVTTNFVNLPLLESAKLNGFALREKARINKDQIDWSSIYPSFNGLPLTYWQDLSLRSNQTIYLYEITYPLKMAYPNKEQRRNWPRV